MVRPFDSLRSFHSFRHAARVVGNAVPRALSSRLVDPVAVSLLALVGFAIPTPALAQSGVSVRSYMPAESAGPALPAPDLPSEPEPKGPSFLTLPLVPGLGDVTLDTPPDIPSDLPLRWSHTPRASAPLGLVAQIGALTSPAESDPVGGSVGPFVRLAGVPDAPVLSGRLFLWQADPAPRDGWDCEETVGASGTAVVGRSFAVADALYADGSTGYLDLGPVLEAAGLEPTEVASLVFEASNVDLPDANARIQVLSFSPRGAPREAEGAFIDPAGGALWYEGAFRLERTVGLGGGESVTARLEGDKVPALTPGSGHFAPQRLLLLHSGGLLGVPYSVRAFVRDGEGNEGERVQLGSGVILGSTIELDVSGIESREPATWDPSGAAGETPYDLVLEMETDGARVDVPFVLPQGRVRPATAGPMAEPGGNAIL